MTNKIRFIGIAILIIIIPHILYSSEKDEEPLMPGYYKSYGHITFQFPLLQIGYSYSNSFFSQLNLKLQYCNDEGFYKNAGYSLFDIGYGYRFDNDKSKNHRGYFLLFQGNGLLYKTLLSYGDSTNNSNSGDFMFHNFGVKLIEYSNLEFLENDFNLLRLNYNLILENRIINRPYQFLGKTDKNNFYLIPSFFAGVTMVAFDNKIAVIDKNILKETFWDIDYGLNLEIGYELNSEIPKRWIANRTNENDSFVPYINSISCYVNYRNFTLNDFHILTLGSKLKLDFGYYFQFNINFNENIFDFNNNSKKIYNAFINYQYPLNSPTRFK